MSRSLSSRLALCMAHASGAADSGRRRAQTQRRKANAAGPPRGPVAVIRGLKAIFCTIPKSGSTTWRMLLRRVEGLSNWHNAHSSKGMTYLTSLSQAEYREVMLDPTWLRVRRPPRPLGVRLLLPAETHYYIACERVGAALSRDVPAVQQRQRPSPASGSG